MRQLVSNLSEYGTMGTSSETYDINDKLIKIGDVISYKYNGRYITAIVANCGGGICPMGLCGMRLSSNVLSEMKIIIPFTLVTDEIAMYVSNLKIEEVESKKLTIEEVSKLLGYPVEIVEV